MLLSHREVHCAELGVRFADVAILHSLYRVTLQIREGFVDDESLLFSHFSRRWIGRSNVICPLEGEVRIRRGGTERLLAPGDWLGEHRDSGWHMRREGRSRTLILEWDPGPLAIDRIRQGASGRLAPASLRALRELAARLFEKEARREERAHRLGEVLRLLRAEGLPLEEAEAGALIEEVPPHLQALAQTVDPTLSALCRGPALGEVQDALGYSRPAVLKYLQEFNERYAYNASGGWRELLQRWRVTMGACFMSAPAATTERVSRILGYASPTAFCHAFANRGLPSPGAVPERLRQLA